MSGHHAARHLRRRRWWVRLGLAVVAVLGLSSSLVGLRILRGDERIPVTVLVGGIAHPVRVGQPATVGAALHAARIVPKPGRLLSLVTKKVLDPELTPVELTVDGMPAEGGSLLVPGSTVSIVEPPDVHEQPVDGSTVIPAPPMPQVIHGLWHPGQPGLALNRRGAVSGELVAEVVVQEPMPPAPVTGKLVALTFDDGPWATTPEVLRVLREKNVKATFCVVGRQLRNEGLEVTRAAVAEGHHLCNHTVNHDAGLQGKPQKALDDEIRGGNRILLDRLGVKPAYYRPPGGRMSAAIVATAKDEGQQVLLWTVDTKDFQKPPPEAILATIMASVQPGGVVLLHDGGGDRAPTLHALGTVIDQLRAAGYELVLPGGVPPVPAAPVTATALPA